MSYKIAGVEEQYIEKYQSLLKGKQVGLRYASHVMQGKTYLYSEISKLVREVGKTDGGTTSNRRIDWGIEKSHSNDGIVITGLKPDSVDVYEYKIQPLRKKRKCLIDKNLEIVQGDRVKYKPRDKKIAECYVTAILESGSRKGYYKLRSIDGSHSYGPVSVKSLKLVVRDKGLRIS